jgi:hypothetical protein
MTSRRNPPRRLSGNSCSRARRGWRRSLVALIGAACLWAGAAHAERDGAALKQTLAGATIDWEAGTIAATAGAAADLRMPSVDLSRPGAQRRAQASAVAKLRTALASLPLGSGNKLGKEEIERALGRARALDVQYQSNGGAVVRMELRFGDWLETPPPVAAAISVPSIRLGAAPTAKIGKRDVRVGAAVYRVDAKADKNAIDAKVDQTGRIVVAGDAQVADKLARGSVMIYVGKLQR